MVPHVQLSTNCVLGCFWSLKNIHHWPNSKLHCQSEGNQNKRGEYQWTINFSAPFFLHKRGTLFLSWLEQEIMQRVNDGVCSRGCSLVQQPICHNDVRIVLSDFSSYTSSIHLLCTSIYVSMYYFIAQHNGVKIWSASLACLALCKQLVGSD
jgi:hypothetical protein